MEEMPRPQRPPLKSSGEPPHEMNKIIENVEVTLDWLNAQKAAANMLIEDKEFYAGALNVDGTMNGNMAYNIISRSFRKLLASKPAQPPGALIEDVAARVIDWPDSPDLAADGVYESSVKGSEPSICSKPYIVAREEAVAAADIHFRVRASLELGASAWVSNVSAFPAIVVTALDLKGASSMAEGALEYYTAEQVWSDGARTAVTELAAFSIVSKPAVTLAVFNGNLLQIDNNATTGDGGALVIKATHEGMEATKTITVTDSTVAAATLVVLKANLINADNATVIKALTDNSSTDLNTLATRNLNLRIDTNPAKVGSLRIQIPSMGVDGYENQAPYSLGDNPPNYNAFVFPVGPHTMTLTAFSGTNGSGTAGTPLVINFTITDSKAAPVTQPYKIHMMSTNIGPHSKAVLADKFGATEPWILITKDDIREGSSTIVDPATGLSPYITFSPTRLKNRLDRLPPDSWVWMDWESGILFNNWKSADPVVWGRSKQEWTKMLRFVKDNYPQMKCIPYGTPFTYYYGGVHREFNYHPDALNPFEKFDGMLDWCYAFTTSIYYSYAEEEGKAFFGSKSPVGYTSTDYEMVRLKGRNGTLAYLEENLNFGLETANRFGKEFIVALQPEIANNSSSYKRKVVQPEAMAETIRKVLTHEHPTLKTKVSRVIYWTYAGKTGATSNLIFGHSGGLTVYGSRTSANPAGTPWTPKVKPANWETLTQAERDTLGAQLFDDYDRNITAAIFTEAAAKLGL